MRPIHAILATLFLAGCGGGAGSAIDSLGTLRPSAEVTSSVSKPSAPIVREVAAPSLASADRSTQPDGPVAALSIAEETVEPEAQAVAMLTTPKPSVRSAVQPAMIAPGKAKIYRHQFRDAKPINFGKRKPQDHAVHGVDVSRWQANIDWKELRRNGANFVFIKATDGGDHLDPMFMKNWIRADEAGLKRGAYHFFYWCRVASEQADWFIRNVPRVEGALPPVIDVEWNGESRCKRRPTPEQVREKMRVFMEKLERHYGQRPIIYTAPDFYRDNLRGHFTDYPFWLRAVAQHPSQVYPGRDWVFWQYSGSGLSQGVNGKIDLNVFAGSEAQWHKWVARNAYGSRTN